MKRYVMLIAFTLIAAVGIIISGTVIRNSMIVVNAVKVVPITVENTVTCTGKVEYWQTTNVYVPKKSVANNIFVSVGDEVNAGQSLLTINPIETGSGSLAADSQTTPEGYQAYENLYKQDGQYNQTNSSSSSSSNGSTSSPAPEEKISAPVSGEITSISVERQGFASPAKPVMVIANKAELQVRLSVNESQIADIKEGQKAIITGVGFKNATYTGTVRKISSEAKTIATSAGQETVIEVLVNVSNPDGLIKTGYTAKVKIITSECSNVLVAPYNAVRADNSGNEYVFKLDGSKAVKVPISTKREFDDGFEVIGGIKKDDKIILDPDNISNGSYVIPTLKGMVQANG